MKTKSILLAGALALAIASPSAFAHDSGATRVKFSKCPIANPAGSPPGTLVTNEGPTTTGAIGKVDAYVMPGSFVELAPNVKFLSAIYVVDAGDHSFTAHVVGWYDLNLGTATLRGVVSQGWHLGSNVIDQFHQIAGGCVAGTLTLRAPDDDDDD
jgi:hypothetical protein